MVQIKGYNISGYIHAVLFSIFLFIGLGSISWFHVVGVCGIIFFSLVKAYRYSEAKPHNLNYHFNTIDVTVIVLFLGQILLYGLSTYKPNSSIPLFQAYLFVIVYFYLKWIFTKWDDSNMFGRTETTNDKLFSGGAINVLAVVISVVVGLLALLAFLQFLLFQFNIQYHGGQDITNFRAMYSPLGMLLNDWISYLILFLSFAVIPIINRNSVLRIISVISTFLISLCLIVTFTRGAYIALAFFVISSTALMAYIFIKTANRIACFIPVVLIASTMVAGFLYFNGAKTTAGMVITESQNRSISGRQVLWDSAFDMFKSYPVTGVGQRNFIKEKPAFIKKTEGSYFTNRVTNTYLQILSEQGLVGFFTWGLLFISIVSGMLLLILRKTNGFCLFRFNECKKMGVECSIEDKILASLFFSAIFAFGIREVVFSSFLYNTGLILIITIMASWISYKVKPILFFSRKPQTIILSLIFILLSFYIILNTSLHLSANSKSEKSLQAFIVGDNEKARAFISSAIQIQPSNAFFYSLQAYYSDSVDIQQILSPEKAFPHGESLSISLNKAVSLSPNDALFHHNLGMYYFLKRDLVRARECLNRAVSLEPFNELYKLSLGFLAYSHGDDNEVVEQLVNAALLRPDVIDSEFWTDSSKRLNLDSVLRVRVEGLHESGKQSDIIAIAKLGRLQMYLGDTVASKVSLKQVVEHLPNMNRPWYFLAEIALHEGDSVNFLSYIKRSIDLDGMDYLPLVSLGDYYFNLKQYGNSEFYYISALRGYNLALINHSYNIRGLYSSDLVVNLFYPNALFRYYRPELKFDFIIRNLDEIFDRSENITAKTFLNDYSEGFISLSELLDLYDSIN